MRPASIGKSHRITRQEAVKFISEKFGVQIREA
jgi:hypothetical protein